MTFSDRAARLAGAAGLAFGWAPDAFWRTTPAELRAMLVQDEGRAPPDRQEIARLQELFPDG